MVRMPTNLHNELTPQYPIYKRETKKDEKRKKKKEKRKMKKEKRKG